jgi:hypothetical protein
MLGTALLFEQTEATAGFWTSLANGGFKQHARLFAALFHSVAALVQIG